jgi:enamine deaminase RidA (YjgF/YER057c/UK114 family)
MPSAMIRLLIVGGYMLSAEISQAQTPVAQSDSPEERLIEYLEADAESGTSAAVLVGKTPLAHTGQILPWQADGNLVAEDQPAKQVRQVLANLEKALKAGGSGFEHLVRLHVCVARAEIVPEVQRQFRSRFPESVRPAVTWVVGSLPHPQALVAIDAVAAAPTLSAQGVTHHTADGLPRGGRGADVSILPTGRTVYISGQAERAETLAGATRGTLASLAKTLEHMELDLSHVVQLKCFLKPMSDVAAVDREIAEFFKGRTVPATVHVEWTMSLPIEIELIAWAPDDKAPQAQGDITFLTPPGMRASPIYARVVVIRHDRSLYTAGLYGSSGSEAEAEVRQIFGRLGKLLDQAGSDFRHLVKATYYVANDAVSGKLNEVRPDFYDPARPPAASKAGVQGVGDARRHITVDMIAIPKR